VPFKGELLRATPDETTRAVRLVLRTTLARVVGDAESVRGTLSLQQPAWSASSTRRAYRPDVLIGTQESDPRLPAVSGGRLSGRGSSRALRVVLRALGGRARAARTDTGRSALENGRRARRRRCEHRSRRRSKDAGRLLTSSCPVAVLATARGGNKPWLQELADPGHARSRGSHGSRSPETTARALALRIGGDHLKVDTYRGVRHCAAHTSISVSGPDVIRHGNRGRGHTSYGRYGQNIGVNAARRANRSHTTRLVASRSRRKQGARLKVAASSPLVTTEGSARPARCGIGQAITVVTLNDRRARGRALRGVQEHAFLPGTALSPSQLTRRAC
jgi:hypothetical protein